MIERDPKYYLTGYDGEDPFKAPFYLRSLIFDGPEGDLNNRLIVAFNSMIREHEFFKEHCLSGASSAPDMPKKIVIVNASHDALPTSYETARVFESLCKEKGREVPIKVVNTREELTREVEEDPENTLLFSQCVDKNVYNVRLAPELEKMGVVLVPGKVTAPGSVFSDKDSTYRLLSEYGKDWTKVAKYKKVDVEEKDIHQVVDDIFESIYELEQEIGQRTFFCKPEEGGGGLGGFRITKTDDGFIIPDLSKVTGDLSEIHPTYIDIDTTNEAKMRELLWIYRMFASDEKTRKSYLKVQLPVMSVPDEEAITILKGYVKSSEKKRNAKMKTMVTSRDVTHKRLCEAIEKFEKKYGRRYIPLVNEHLDFGLWGLRAHFRLSCRGPVLETMYHRIFQLGFTEEGMGYLGGDNISNKQTGELEITRLGPINQVMLDALGGQTELFDTLMKGADALYELSRLLPEGEREVVPLRLQLDLAPISKRIGEGNADTARGMCLASRWSEFIYNATEWFEDSLKYYNWKKKRK